MINTLRNINESLSYVLDGIIPGYRKRKRFPRKFNYSPEAPFSELEIYIIPQVLPSHSTIFDVGANIGNYTYAFESENRFDAIYAFEPIPALYHRLRKLFPRQRVYPYAMSDKQGEAVFSVPLIAHRRYDTRGTLQTQAQESKQTGVQQFTVTTTTIDDFCSNQNIASLSCIKIDVEGHEFEVLKGARQTLVTQQPLVLVEIEQRHHHFPIADIFDFMESAGYEGMFLHQVEKVFYPLSSFEVSQHQPMNNLKQGNYHNNFVFIPRSRQDLKTKLIQTAATVFKH